MSLGFISKRKLSKAIGLAVEDRKIPASPSTFYRYGNDAGLIWENLNQSAPINARPDGTIYIGYAVPFERGSHFDKSRTGFEPR